jgi:SnoaL-like domain
MATAVAINQLVETNPTRDRITEALKAKLSHLPNVARRIQRPGRSCTRAGPSVSAELNHYDATTHFVGQSTIFTLTDHRATGEAYCLAHHVTGDGGKRRLTLASLRYLDTFVKMDGAWLFAERRLYVDWLEERTLP